ncbi:MAG: hypothetical protein LBJ77_02830 [Holosporales bacterium]|nr:hypothetical protein [Holosporales bacterium]
MVVEISQMDIFGNGHRLNEEKEKKPTSPQSPSKGYREVSLEDGLLESSAATDAVLIHRILQRKLIYSGLTTDKQKLAFLRVFENEMRIKGGKQNPITSTRYSLLALVRTR